MKIKTTLLELPQSWGMLRGTITELESYPTDTLRTLICVHGFEWPASIDQKFRHLAEALPHHGYRVIRFDYRGNGLSDGDFKGTRIDTMLEDLTSVIESLDGNTQIDFAGYSIGTSIAALYWKQFPQRVNKILFFGAAFDHSSISRYVTLKRLLPSSLPFRESIAWAFRSFAPVKKLLEKSFYPTRFSHEISSAFYGDLLHLNTNDIVESIPQGQKALVHGTRDESSPRKNVTAVFEQECVVKGGDHHLEKKEYQEQWREFVEGFFNN